MLNVENLKDILVEATYNKGYDDYWIDLSEAISDYISNNAEISATYIGNIGTIPSILNGVVHKFHASLTVLSNVIKSAAASSGVPGLNIAISAELSKTKIFSSYNGLFTVVTSATFTSLYFVVYFPEDDYQSVIDKMANGIINAVKNSVPLPPVLASPAQVIASDGSTGALTVVGIA